MKKELCLAAALVSGCAFALDGLASERMPYQEYANRIKAATTVAPLKSDLFGEALSLYNGATEFSATDIDLAGNHSIPVRLARRIKVESLPLDAQIFGGFGVWDLDVPAISGTFVNDWLTPQGTGPLHSVCKATGCRSVQYR